MIRNIYLSGGMQWGRIVKVKEPLPPTLQFPTPAYQKEGPQCIIETYERSSNHIYTLRRY